ncbi:S-adenosyl-L-methionine-dependent methyltransferase [Clavulina sp. PMI_390]|nr:S-adenosyl-L-methionine-dependent methyltransferase [Clavulina sp. PMI_390]
MSEPSSTTSTRVPPPQAVHHEQRTAANSAAHVLPHILSLKDRSPTPLRLLDVGAGSGSISATLAQAIGPNGHVVGIDVNPEIIPRAEAVAASYGLTSDNITFQVGDVYKLPFEDGSFDVVHCHQVLTHLTKPVDALKEMIRVTKVGGLVSAREGDVLTEVVWPELPGLVKFHKFVETAMSARGGSLKSGRQLLSWALEAGAQRDQIIPTYSTWSYTEPAEKENWAQGMIAIASGGRIRDAGLKMGVTEEEFAEMIEGWKEWSGRDDATLVMMNGEVVIRK